MTTEIGLITQRPDHSTRGTPGGGCGLAPAVAAAALPVAVGWGVALRNLVAFLLAACVATLPMLPNRPSNKFLMVLVGCVAARLEAVMHERLRAGTQPLITGSGSRSDVAA